MIFNFLCIFLCSIIIFLNMFLKKNMLSPLNFFMIIWLVINVFSRYSIEQYGLYSASEKSYFIIFLGTLSFFLGYVLYEIFKRKIISKKAYDYKIKYKFIILLNIICSLFYIYVIIYLFRELGTLNLWSIQQYVRRHNLDFISSKILKLLNSFVLGPGSFASPIICAMDMVFGKKNKTLLFSTFIMGILKMISTASRMSFLLFFVYIIIFLFLKQDKEKRNIKIKKRKKYTSKIILLTLIIALSFAILSISRNISFVRGFVLDFSIQPKMLDIWINNIDMLGVYGHGKVLFSGFLFLVGYPLKLFLNLTSLPFNYQYIYDIIDSTVAQWVNVGNGIPANAYVSIFWYCYLDGGYTAIVLEMLLIGFVTNRIYDKVNLKDYKTIANYCLVMLVILFSFVRFQFAQINFFLVVIFINFLMFKKSYKEE